MISRTSDADRRSDLAHAWRGIAKMIRTAHPDLPQLADVAERIAAWEEGRPLGWEGVEVVEP
jgi:hypothetical protein